MLVAVEGDGPAVALEVTPRRIEVGEGRLGLYEVQVHDPAGGVIDEHQQCTGRPAVLEPAVLRAVDLHQLARTIPAIAGLMQPALPLRPVHPQPRLDHPASERLPAKRDAVQLGELLRRQGGPKIGVALPHERQGGIADRLRLAPVRGPPTALENQPGRAFQPKRPQEPKHLPALQRQQPGRRRDCHPAPVHVADHA